MELATSHTAITSTSRPIAPSRASLRLKRRISASSSSREITVPMVHSTVFRGCQASQVSRPPRQLTQGMSPLSPDTIRCPIVRRPGSSRASAMLNTLSFSTSSRRGWEM